MKRCISILGCFFAVLSLASGAKTGAQPDAKSDATPYISLHEVPEVTVAPGKTEDAVVSLTVNKGLHIQANPASQRNLIPTTVRLVEDGGVLPGQAVYPNGVGFRLEGAETEIAGYEGKVEIRVPLTVAPSATASKVTLKGKLRYQACNEKNCFFPKTVPISVPVRIVPKG